MSMAVVVVADPAPQEILNHKAELDLCRLDSAETRETTSQCNGVYVGKSRFGSNAPTTASELSVVARQCPSGNGHVQQAATAGEWVGGPPRWTSTTVDIFAGQSESRQSECEQVQSWRFESRRFQAMEYEKAMQEKARHEKVTQENARHEEALHEKAMQDKALQERAMWEKALHHKALQEKAANIPWIDESTNPLVKKELVQQVSVKEGIAEKVEEDGKVETKAIIDLDMYEDAKKPSSDISMALVPVPDQQPQEILKQNTDLSIVRVDNAETRETTSQCSSVHDGRQVSYTRQSPPGNGNVQAPKASEWVGPPRWSSTTVGILTVQCARCLKWRVVPSREKYEEIREHILETPWVCENARQWRPDANCDLPTDLEQDSGSVWAIDKPNLPSSPPGWSRKVVVRRDCSTRFADVYYSAPDGKTLRSSVEVARYLEENPGSVPPGTKLNQFSFTSPRPLPGVWVGRKRNRTKLLDAHSNSQECKKAKTPQPLAKQLAQKLLHGTPPPSLPVAPSFPSSGAQSYPLPFVASFPAPSLGPDLVQFVAMQASSHPSTPNSSNAQDLPLFTTVLPLRECPPVTSCVDRFSRPLHQASPYFHQGMTTSSTGIHTIGPAMAAFRMKQQQQQQQSRLRGQIPMSQPVNVAGVSLVRNISVDVEVEPQI